MTIFPRCLAALAANAESRGLLTTRGRKSPRGGTAGFHFFNNTNE